MAPRSATGGQNAQQLQQLQQHQQWVTVSWMPHASLSQSSYIAFRVRSLLACLDDISLHLQQQPEDWQVKITIHGIAGLDLVPVSSMTEFAPLLAISRSSDDIQSRRQEYHWNPMVSNVTHKCQWDSLMQIPLRWRDLPRDAYLKFQVTGTRDSVVYVTTLPFFDAYGKLQTGMTKLSLNQQNSSISNQVDAATNPGLMTPSNTNDLSSWKSSTATDKVWKASRILEQLDRFERYTARGHESAPTGTSPHQKMIPASNKTSVFGEIPSVPWLDNMAREYCEKTIREAEEKAGQNCGLGDKHGPAYLVIELPTFEVPVIHEETFYPTPQQGPSGSVTPLDLALYRQKRADAAKTKMDNSKNSTSSAAKSTNLASPPSFHPLEMISFLDYEDENDNPIDDKYRTLAHDLLRGLVDPALKPDRVQRDKLAAIIASPSHHPTREEKDLLWRFRFSLVDNRRALTKFLLAVDWTVESEVVQAAELLEQWRKRSPIEVTDALKLLGKQVAYQTNLVRAYAIDTLASAPDEELNLYLLQLVQALKFENIQETNVNHQVGSLTNKKSSLATFLIKRASRNVQLANYLYWYLKFELQDPAHGARYREIFAALQQTLSQTPFPTNKSAAFQNASKTSHVRDNSGAMGRSFIHSEGKESHGIMPFNKIVESVSKFGDKLMGTEASSSMLAESSCNQAGSPHGRSVWDALSDQDLFISGIMDAQMSYATKGKQAAKEAHLRSILAKEGYDKAKNSFPLPCAPEIMVNGVSPQKAKVFRSAVYPALIEFNVDYVAEKNDFGQRTRKHMGGKEGTSSHPVTFEANKALSSYRVIMKTGDDLRQDQLAMMMIKLMDGLLKRASLDLFVTPYSIIATSPTSGMIEFVEQSSPVSAILANHNNSILQYFQAQAPQKGAKYGVRPDVISTYVRSVAGGSVITYLLGVGDRHLDNLMITRSGHFFHIDFGFMFGRDPKPLPPAFRLTREMVEGMGGMDSSEYRQFCSLACQAFNALRKSAGLVLNLLHLMSDAGIEDLTNNPAADAEGVIAKVEERFRLDLTDEQAERFFLNLINDSLAAIAPRLMDVFHSIAVARR
jgi:phosphatidylinositol 3-kinase